MYLLNFVHKSGPLFGTTLEEDYIFKAQNTGFCSFTELNVLTLFKFYTRRGGGVTSPPQFFQV